MAADMPETIGNFRIVEKLGQGGMGAVFRAMHGTLERPVALKILPAEFANNPEYVMRFLREARTIATLRHENVVQVYDAGEQGGQYYIAMELVDGENLLKYAEGKGKLTEQEGLALLLQAAKGLAAAHAKSLVHRDIKPENLLLGKDNVLRIVDFGLVMESTSTTQLTATGACLGTPMYMSPEQADGEQADARTDLYSLGVTFYRVFTGHPPFSSPTVMNLLFKHKFEAPPDPRSPRPDLSQDVAYLLLHLMAKKREERPQGAQALIEMIEGIKQGKHIPPPPVFVAPVTDAFSGASLISPRQLVAAQRATQKKILLATAAVVALLIGLGLYLFLSGRRTPDDPGAGVPVTNPALHLQDRGDVAFAAGRYAEALENFREALAEAPQNPELKTRIARTEQAMKFKDLMQQAELAESRGELDVAAARYGEAIAVDEGETAKPRLARVKEKIASNAALSSSRRNEDRDQQARKALEAEKEGKYEVAADFYARAAALADGDLRIELADKASECRRQNYLAKGAAAEGQADYATAAAMYSRALNIKTDPAVSAKLEKIQKLAANTAEIDAPFANAMRAAQAALTARNFPQARLQLGVALGLKPNDTEASAKLKELDRLEAAAKTPPPNVANSAAVVRKVDVLLASGKDEAAVAELAAGRAADPAHADLKNLKTAVDRMQTCATLYAELQKIVDSGQDTVRDMRDQDDDNQTRQLKRSLTDLSTRFADRARRVRPLVLEHNYDSVRLCLDTAKNDAKELAEDLATAAQTCETHAEKAGKKGEADFFGVVKIGGGDSKKAEKYREFAKAFKKLAADARALRD